MIAKLLQLHLAPRLARLQRLCIARTIAELDAKRDHRTGTLVEYDVTSKIFSAPSDERTENYITGRFG